MVADGREDYKGVPASGPGKQWQRLPRAKCQVTLRCTCLRAAEGPASLNARYVCPHAASACGFFGGCAPPRRCALQRRCRAARAAACGAASPCPLCYPAARVRCRSLLAAAVDAASCVCGAGVD